VYIRVPEVWIITGDTPVVLDVHLVLRTDAFCFYRTVDESFMACKTLAFFIVPIVWRVALYTFIQRLRVVG